MPNKPNGSKYKICHLMSNKTHKCQRSIKFNNRSQNILELIPNLNSDNTILRNVKKNLARTNNCKIS